MNIEKLIMYGSPIILAAIIIFHTNKPEPPKPPVIVKETIIYVPIQKPQPQRVEWLFPPGNQRLNIPPNSGLEREWQQQGKRYKPDYTVQVVEIN